MRRFLTFTVILITLAIAAPESRTADEISGELVGLNVSLAAEKQLVVFDQLVAAEEWIAAIDLLDRLKVDSSSVLVKVAPGRFVGLPGVIQQRLCRLPVGGLEVYRRRHNSAAAALLSRARSEHDNVALERLVETAAATVAGQSALPDLAAQAASRGDRELALRLWGRLFEGRVRESRVFPPSLISLSSADPDLSRAALPKAVVARHLLGASLSSAELTSLGGDAATWKVGGRSIGELSTGQSSPPPAGSSIGAYRWSTVATANCPLLEYQAPLSVAAGPSGVLFINNGEQVRALDARTGEPSWPTGMPLDVGVVYEEDLLNIRTTRELPNRIAGGVCSGDRYFGVVAEAPRWRSRPGLVPLSGSLVALDAGTGQGRVLWRVESRNLPEHEWLLHGEPEVSRGHWPSEELVVVPLCRPAPQVELAVAAFSADDGHLVWWTRIGTCATEVGQPLASTQLVVAGGLVVARTLTGVVVALAPRDGHIQWASTGLVSSPPVAKGSPSPLLDCRAGRLVIGDPVQSQVAGLSLDSGEELWRQDIPFSIQGVTCPPHGQVLVAGSRLRALSLHDGVPLWEHGFDDLAAAGTGNPVVTGETVLWPTRTGIWGLDLVSGRIEFERRLTAGPVTAPLRLLPLGQHWLLSRPEGILCLQRSGASVPEHP